jgi:AAA domain
LSFNERRKLKMLTPDKVFTPGKLPINPENVYASRGRSEEKFKTALDRSVVPLVYGEYGVGNTSMARYTINQHFSDYNLVNIESVGGMDLNQIIDRILEHIEYTQNTKTIKQSSTSHKKETGGKAGIGVPGISANINSTTTNQDANSETTETENILSRPSNSRVLALCEEQYVILLLDELHKASKELLEELSDFLKSYSNANCSKFKIALLGTSSDATKLVQRDPGVDRLLQEIKLSAMQKEEGRALVQNGMNKLGIQYTAEIVDSIVNVFVGAPNVLQFLCLESAISAFKNTPRVLSQNDLDSAVNDYVESKESRLYQQYMGAIENTGSKRYRKQILRAASECDDEYFTMAYIQEKVSIYLGTNVRNTDLSGSLRKLKGSEYGPILRDVEKLNMTGTIQNYSTFCDPGMKAYIRMVTRKQTSL